MEPPKIAQTWIEYAVQVVPVGNLAPQQIIAGIRAPKGFRSEVAQVVPVVLHVSPQIGELHAQRNVSGLCLLWHREVTELVHSE